MLLAQLVEASQRVAATSARNAKIAALAACLAQLEPEEIEIGVAYLSGETRQGKIGVGYGVLRKLEVEPAGEPSLRVLEVDGLLEQLQGLKGAGSGTKRVQLLTALFARATQPEQEFLIKLLIGELRQGALEGVMLDAVAKACSVPATTVRRAMMFAANLGRIARAAREGGESALAEYRLQLFRPLAPMLAQTASDAADAIAQLGEAAFEWKLDGARIQVHRDGDEVRIYTRALNEVLAVPEIVEAVRALPAKTLVLDGEAIAMRADGTPHTFQTTMKRFSRKEGAADRGERLSPFFFDVLHIDGKDLLDAPAGERTAALHALLPEAQRLPRLVTGNTEEANAFIDKAIDTGHEGVVAKSLTATYQAGRRGVGWLKIKRAHTVDLVVLAVEWGSGRRKGTLSNLHLGARDPNGGFVMLGKTFKGMTDEMLAFQTKKLLELETHRDDYTVYVRPELVVEVAFDGLQTSPHYPGGVALRFARIKGYRLDKRADEVDTLAAVRDAAKYSSDD
jgi:DNA ligase 1